MKSFLQKGTVFLKQEKTEDAVLQDPYAELPPVNPRRWTSYLPIFISIFGCLLMLAVVIGFFGTYDKALDNYFSVYVSGKDGRIKRLAPAQYWEWLEQEKGITVDEVRENFAATFPKKQAELEKTVGEKVKYTYSIKNESKLKDQKLKDLSDSFERYGIEEDDIKEAYQVNLSVTYSGSKRSVTKNNSGYVVKISGNWYLYWDQDDGTAEFPIPSAGSSGPALADETSADEYNRQFLPDAIT